MVAKALNRVLGEYIEDGIDADQLNFDMFDGTVQLKLPWVVRSFPGLPVCFVWRTTNEIYRTWGVWK